MLSFKPVTSLNLQASISMLPTELKGGALELGGFHVSL